ncbi:MAG: serine hydrolase domain-containing protein [Terrimicrobiaceae bacterium]
MKNDAQTRIQNLLDRLTADGSQRGLQVAVYREGELIVDAWSGVSDHRTGASVRGDTLFPVFSVSKGMAATLAHQAVGRGLLTYDQPLSAIWPEFAAHGKEGITLRHALNHSAGVPHLPQGIGFADLADWDRMSAAVAQLVPVSEPGSRAEYHAITYGSLVGEAVRRADGRSFSRLLREEIAVPLGLEGMYVGIPNDVESRVAFLEEYDLAPPADDSQPSSVPAWLGPLHAFMNRPDMRRACLPASSGIMNARAIARHYAALLPGGVEGIELLPPGAVREATAWQGLKNPQGEDSPFALGYQMLPGLSAPGSAGAPFGHGGYGGSLGFAEMGSRLAVGLTRNLFNKQNVADLVVAELNATFEKR